MMSDVPFTRHIRRARSWLDLYHEDHAAADDMNVRAVFLLCAISFLIGFLLDIDPFVWVGLLLLVVGLFGALFQSADKAASRRECPHCRELMRKDASVCPHCQRDVATPSAPVEAG